LAFGPQALASGPSGWVLVLTCAVALGLVFLGDLHAPGGSVGAVGFIPVVAAAWLGSREQTIATAMVAIAYRVAAVLMGFLPVTTGLAEIITVPILALLAHVAADFVMDASSTEQSLRHARAEGDRLAALEGAKSEFLRLASHELRGPVSVVAGYLSMLDDGTLGELPPGARKAMPILLSKVKAVSMMIEQMLETARLEDHRLVLEVRPIDLGGLLRDCVEEIRPVAGDDHPIKLDLPGERVVAPADRSRVKTIVANLLDNAVKYSPEGGPVSCRLVHDGDRAVVEVEDRGIGIAPEDRDRLFQRFSRIEKEATLEIPGTGLGLYVSRELARLHGGELQVESEAGRGSTFILELPLDLKRKKGRAPAAD
jgi:signal transduction histidine kinase